MALEHGDLFFINRSGSTYKIEAVELGDYLTSNRLDDGTYIVNDGLLSISNSGDSGIQPFVITSANTPLNSVIDFDENFVVRSVGNDASITLNYEHVSSEILCSDADGKTPGFSENNCGCISFDWDYFTDRLPCYNGGIVDNNGCIKINLCGEGVLILSDTGIPGRHCLDVNLCGGSGVINDGGCLDLDYALIANKIVCSPDSGLNSTNGDKCISVNFEKVMAEMGLGVLKSLDNSVLFTNNGDLTKGNVDLKVNPLVVQDTKINNITTGGACLKVVGNQGDLTVSDVKIYIDDDCLISFIEEHSSNNTDGDGNVVTIKKIKAGEGIEVTPNGNLTTNDVTISLEAIDDGGCWSDSNKAFTAQRVYCAKSGGAKDPAIVLGTSKAAADPDDTSTDAWWIGINANQQNGSFALSTGRGWTDYDICGGHPPAEQLVEGVDQGYFGSFFSVAVGYHVFPNHKTSGLVSQKGDPVVAFIDCQKYNCPNITGTKDPDFTGGGEGPCGPYHPQWKNLPDIFDPQYPNPDSPTGKGGHVSPNNGNKAEKEDRYTRLFHGSMNPYNEAGGHYKHFDADDNEEKIGRFNRFGFDKNSTFRGDFPEINVSDTRVAYGATDEERVTTIESLIEKIGNFSCDGGLVRAALKSDDGSPDYPLLYLDAEELGEIAPSLVEYSYTVNTVENVYDDDGEILGMRLSDDLSDAGVGVSNVHYRSLSILSMIAHRIRKNQVQDLQARVDTLEARLAAAGIP